MAKKKPSAPTQGMVLRPKKIQALEALLGDDIGSSGGSDELDFLEGNAVDLTISTGELNIVDLVLDSIEESSLVPKDLKFDDSSMPQAANFLEWCTGDEFLKASPYLEQALIGIKLFGEYCVAKGSMIQTSKGLMTIEDALHNPTKTGMNPIAFTTVALTGSEEVAFGGMTSKKRKCLKITYSSGKSIIVTPEHRVLRLNPNYTFSWVEAQNLEVGSFGVSRVGANVWPTSTYEMPKFNPVRSKHSKAFTLPKEMTNEFARLIGYIITDGSIGKNGIGFTSLDDSGLADDFAYCYEHTFGVPVDSMTTGQMKPNSKIPYTGIRCHGRNLVDYLEYIGLTGLSYDKKIPKCILESKKEHVVECLRAMMDCDGYTDHKIGITLSSPVAVKQLSLLMENLGLYGQYSETSYDASNLIRESDVRKDARGIWSFRGLRSDYAAIIGTKNELRKERLFGLDDIVPSHSSNVAGTAYPGRVPYGKELFEYSRTLRTSYHDKGLTHSKFGRRDFFLIEDTLADPEFTDFWTERDTDITRRLGVIADNDLLFSTVVSIEDAGYHEVYDVTVPEGENFQCDGVIVHNCPECSDLEWMDINAHEAIEGIDGLRKHVQVLEHNKCPECGAKRSTLIDQGKVNFYNELAVNAGQRCLSHRMPVVTASGIMPINHMLIGYDTPGFHKAYRMKAHGGRAMQDVKQVYVSDHGTCLKLKLENGMYIEGTPDHPIRTTEHFKPLSKITPGTKVLVYLGTETWGRVKKPMSLIESALAPRHIALRYIQDMSAYNPETELHTIAVSYDEAPTVWSVLLNSGTMPIVIESEDSDTVHIQYGEIPHRGSLRTVELEVSSIERIEDQVTYDLCMEGLPQFVAAGILNHNSGKSVLVAMLSTYLTHRILKMQSPTGILGIGDNTILHGTFVALTQKQAMDTLWEPYFGYIMASPWFQRYHALIKMYERRYGIEVMKIRDTFVLYRHRNLTVYPAGPDGRILRGRTRLFASIDEIAYFDNNANSNKVKTSAKAVYEALDRSLGTVRAEEGRQIAAGYDGAFTGYFFNISSPVHARDKINELLKLSVGSTKLLGVHAPTWKMNPKMPRTSAFLVEAFRRDPVGANKDYGAQAPLSANPFITQQTDILKSIRDKGRNLCTYTPKIVKFKDGSKQRYAVLNKVARSGKPAIMALDAGFSNNSFAMVVGTQSETGTISVDCVAEVIPLPDIPLNYTKIFEELLLPLAKARNVRVLLADQWNSLKLLSDAIAHGISIAEKYSLKYSDLWTVKTLMESDPSELSIPRMNHLDKEDIEKVLDYDGDEYPRCFEGKPIEHLVMQMMTVQDTGSSVIKNIGATDDSFRAMALMCWGFNSGKYEEELRIEIPVEKTVKSLQHLGTMGRRRIAGSASSSRTAPSLQCAAVAKTRRLR